MPRLNGTGPIGKGSGTGRGLGRCRTLRDGNSQGTDVDQPVSGQNQGNPQGFLGRLRLGKGQGGRRGR